MKKHYKILSIIATTIFSILIICTVLSRVIEISSLKTVEFANPSRSELTIYEESVCSVVFWDITAYSYGLPLRITDVFIEANQKVSVGDLLATADVREYELDLKRRELSVIQMQNLIASLGISEERQLQLEIAEREYELYKGRFPEDGEIRAKSEGVISALNISRNTIANSETDLFEIRNINAQAYARFTMPENVAINFDLGDTVILYYSAVINNNGEFINAALTENMRIERKEFDFIKRDFTFYAPININDIYTGQTFRIKVVHNSPFFDLVIPKNSVHGGTDGNSYVFTLNERDGLFGKEYYVKSVSIEIIWENEYYAAIESEGLNSFSEIIIGSSGMLMSGETVRIY